jgi:hypothetical protein
MQQEALQTDGTWRILGGAGFDPAWGDANARTKVFSLQCSPDNDGIMVTGWVQAREPWTSYRMTIRIDSNYTVQDKTVILG